MENSASINRPAAMCGSGRKKGMTVTMTEKEQGKVSTNIMMKLAGQIVGKRKAILVLFFIACIYCLCHISKVEVENDLTKYLPATTETRRGLDRMDAEFRTFGSGQVLVANITYEQARDLAERLEEIKGVAVVSFYDAEDDSYEDKDREDYYKDASALYKITFDEEEETELSQRAIGQVRDELAGYDAYIYTTVDKDDAAALQADIKVISVIVIAIILLVLLFTSQTYMEIPIFLAVFGVAAILNAGTNYWFGSISFVTNAVGTILQLALAIDYAIILFHRFMEEREHLDTIEAVTTALSKAIPEISSSSLTTVSGMLALMFMQFGIGLDLGRVLTKAIIFSLITVFLLMPALIVMCSAAIEKTRHQNFVPSIKGWGRLVIRLRYITVPVFLLVAAVAVIWSGRCRYIYDVNSIDSARKNEYLISRDRIAETFETTNTMAIVIPKEDYRREAEMIAEIEKIEAVDTIMGLSNIEVGDEGDYILVDELNPQQFSELADVDLDLVRMLYRLYAYDKGQYSALLKSPDDHYIPIIAMVDYIYEEKEKGALDLDDEKSEDIDDLYEAMCKAREQLESEEYSRIVFTLRGAVEGEETFQVIDQIRDIAGRYYEDACVVGDATSNYDLSTSFQSDNTLISVLTALFVGIILLFTFQSASLPFLLVLVIQGSIWINFSIPYLTDSTMFFLCYLIVSSIQMGATIDYAIVLTSRYLALRKEYSDRREALVESIDQAFPTIVTSGTILTCAGFVIGSFTANGTIASLGIALGWGTVTSIILVMTVLPQCLLICDKLIDKTDFSKEAKHEQK